MSGIGQDTALITYTGTALPLGATTTTLFDTSTAFVAAGYIAMNRLKRFQIDLVNSQAGTFTWQKSLDRGVTWIQLATQAAGIGTNDLDLLVENLQDFRIQWINGGVNQTAFSVSMALSGERNKST
jgi:hypothetical protein